MNGILELDGNREPLRGEPVGLIGVSCCEERQHRSTRKRSDSVLCGKRLVVEWRRLEPHSRIRIEVGAEPEARKGASQPKRSHRLMLKGVSDGASEIAELSAEAGDRVSIRPPRHTTHGFRSGEVVLHMAFCGVELLA